MGLKRKFKCGNRTNVVFGSQKTQIMAEWLPKDTRKTKAGKKGKDRR
jgi:hypothetical protein